MASLLQRRQLFLNLFLALSYFICEAYSQNPCIAYHRPCPEDRTEVYRETLPNGRTRYKCCTEGDRLKDAQDTADSCTTSDCVPVAAGRGDLCGQKRTISATGKNLTYMETVRDECTMSNGRAGVLALCCPDGSLDQKLTTILGAEQHEFPHFARVEVNHEICGGTIYNSRFVITASHCVVDKKTKKPVNPKAVSVIFDVLISGKPTDNKYSIKNIYVHPNSSKLKEKHEPLKNDIALLELTKDIVFSDNIQALQLAPEGFEAVDYDETAVIVGFGDTDTLTTSRKLQKANAIIRNAAYTTRHVRNFRSHKPDKDQLLFLGGYQNGKASPSGSGGDSGGPAICRGSDGIAVLCGLTSFGAGNKDVCEASLSEDECHPTAYVRVDRFRTWIQNITKGQDDKKVKIMKKYLYGRDVKSEDYPHQVEITGAEYKCGGTLISKDVVLTAAHCVADDKGKMIAGLQVLKRGGGKPKSEKVKSIKVMEGFQRVGGSGNKRLVKRIAVFAANATWDYPYFKNDLALVKLEKELRGLSGKLPTLAKTEATGSATELAWMKSPKRNGSLAERKFNLISHQDCQTRMDRLRSLGQNYTVDGNLVCGVEDYSGGSRCDRSSGGGLFCGDNVLCGVQTFRLCEFSVPNAFIDVGLSSDWIEKNMKKL